MVAGNVWCVVCGVWWVVGGGWDETRQRGFGCGEDFVEWVWLDSGGVLSEGGLVQSGGPCMVLYLSVHACGSAHMQHASLKEEFLWPEYSVSSCPLAYA